jgi:SagB-type dehydrogenase family enzyme
MSAGPADPGNPRQYETTDRPSPSGGAAHDLEIYPVVRECAGLPAGLYHYEAGVHGLTRVPAAEAHTRRLLQDACSAAGGAAVPQLLLVLTSRFSRLAWKYRGMAYATTLRNVGVLYEAMYLAATAMGLAPCALGCGDSAVFAAATGLDPLAESSVGEFMLGSAPLITAH